MQTLFPEVDKQKQERLVACYSQKYFSKPLGRDDLFPGVYEMLVKLNEAGYLLAVATGKTRVGLQKALQATGTEELFRATRCADETASKPDPRMLREIIKHTNTKKERSLMVGDSVHDLQMAHNAIFLLLRCHVAHTQKNSYNNTIRYCACNSQLNY